MASNHQTTTCFLQFFPRFFSQFDQLKKKTNLLLVQNMFFFRFGPMKSCFFNYLLKLRKIRGKKLGNTRLVVWWFDVANKIFTATFKNVDSKIFVKLSDEMVTTNSEFFNHQFFSHIFIFR